MDVCDGRGVRPDIGKVGGRLGQVKVRDRSGYLKTYSSGIGQGQVRASLSCYRGRFDRG